MSSSRSRRARPPAPVTAEVAIEALGDRGDGLARHAGRRLAVAGALPGERHRVRFVPAGETCAARSLEVLTAAARAAPVCPHFGACGGCAVQHLPPDQARAWKVDRVRAALARRGLGAAVTLGHESPLASRRRLRLAVARRRGGVQLGFRARRAHDVVDIAVCPIAEPALVALLDPLRAVVAVLESPVEAIELTAYAAGVEVVLAGTGAPTLADRERLAAWGVEVDAARLGWRAGDAAAEPLSVRREPCLAWNGLTVAPPLGAFLQATGPAEAHLQGAVARGLEGARRVADLYAGIGTFTAAAVAVGAQVRAVEREPAAVAALRAAGIDAVARDLDRHPLAAEELAGVDAVVLDPPRKGAPAQAAELARSAVTRVVHVACNPVAFARDAATLTAAGFDLGAVAVVDQFRFASEVELVATLDRQKGS